MFNSVFSEQALALNYQVNETLQTFFYLFKLNKFMNISRFFKFEYLSPILFLFIIKIIIKR